MNWCPILSISLKALDIGLLLLTAVGVVFAHHVLLVNSRPNEPPLVRGIVPFVGVALSICAIQKGSSWSADGAMVTYTLYMGGRRMHAVCDPISGIPTVYRNFRTFPSSVLLSQVSVVLFGIPESQANDSGIRKALIDTLAPNLLAQKELK